MSWVSSGVVCVRGAGARAAGGAELLRRLEEAAEVARVQAAVRAALRAAAAHPPAHLLQRLDDELLEITQVCSISSDVPNDRFSRALLVLYTWIVPLLRKSILGYSIFTH